MQNEFAPGVTGYRQFTDLQYIGAAMGLVIRCLILDAPWFYLDGYFFFFALG